MAWILLVLIGVLAGCSGEPDSKFSHRATNIDDVDMRTVPYLHGSAPLKWTHPANNNDNLSPGGTDAALADVAMNQNSEVVVVWNERPNSTLDDPRIYMAEYRLGVWHLPMSVNSHINPRGGYASAPKVAIDSFGNTVVIWTQFNGAEYAVYKSEYRAGVWTHPSGLNDFISIPGSEAFASDVAMADGGAAVITWLQGPVGGKRVYLASYNGVWNYPTNLNQAISPTGLGAYLALTNLRSMRAGGDFGLIVWTQGDSPGGPLPARIFKSEYQNGTWIHPASSNDYINPGNAGVIEYAAAMDKNMNALIVWNQDNGAGKRPAYKSELRNGVWTHPSSLGDFFSLPNASTTMLNCDMDDLGAAAIVWRGEVSLAPSRIFLSEYRQNSWQHPQSSTDAISPNGTAVAYPRVSMSGGGEAIVAWQQRNDVNLMSIFLSEYRKGIWTHPTTLTQYISPPGSNVTGTSVVAASNRLNRAVVIWSQFDPSNRAQIYLSRYW